MADILVIFHSVGGYTFRMAEAIAEGVCSLSGCEANLKQITEPPGADAILLPKVDNRKSDFSDIPVAQVKDLEDCDGLAIGTPVFWGNMSSATKYFLEQTSSFGRSRQTPSNRPSLCCGSQRRCLWRVVADTPMIWPSNLYGPRFRSMG